MMRETNIIRALASLLLLGAAHVHGQVWSERIVQAPSDVTPSGLFGWSVSLDGDLLLVGAPGTTDLGAQSGAAYLFQRNTGGQDQWDLLRKLVPIGVTPGARFGTSVLLRDGRALVGAPSDIVNGIALGALYVFEEDAGGTGNWGFVQRVFAPNGSSGMHFGEAFSLGDLLVVGAPDYDVDPNNAFNVIGGSAAFVTDLQGQFLFVDLYDRGGVGRSQAVFADRCFTPNGASCAITPLDSLVQDTILYTPLPVAGDLVSTEAAGFTIQSSGIQLIADTQRLVCTVVADPNRQIHTFITQADSLVQEGYILPDTDQFDLTNRFGESLAQLGDRLVAGAPGSPLTMPLGRVGVFDRDPLATGGWSSMTQLVPSDPYFGDLFGQAVAVAQEVVAVGAPGHGLDDRGQVYVFHDPAATVLDTREELTISIAPVPANAELTVRIANDVPGEVRVLDAMGRIQITGPIMNSTAVIDVRAIAAGPYVVQVIPQDANVRGRSLPLLILR